MPRRHAAAARLLICCMLVLLATPAGAQSGTVKMPLSAYEQIEQALQPAKPKAGPSHVLTRTRTIDARYERGLLSGRLSVQLELLGQDAIETPVIDADAALSAVRLDGAPATLVRRAHMYLLRLSEPGVHQLEVDFHFGKQDDRLASRVRMRLADGGPTAVKIRLAEPDIVAKLKRGVVTGVEQQPGATVVSGYLRNNGMLDMSWWRNRPPDAEATGGFSAKQHVLYELDQSVIEGRAVVDIQPVGGAIDRALFTVPAQLEITAIEGEHVLQWHHDDSSGELLVVLRHLLEAPTRLNIRFRTPIDPDRSVQLLMPWPQHGAQGALGICAPAGLLPQVAQAKDADRLLARELPSALTELTTKPVLFGFAFGAQPNIELALRHQQQEQLTTTLIDELQASTVTLEGGREVTKLKLRIRNNARQYLAMRLPADATVTHSLIDGQQVRPALFEGQTLFPLHQSERLNERAKQTHKVRPGETLSDIANLYYSDPSQYQRIAKHNRLDLERNDLEVDQELAIPAAASHHAERSFVIELAYERPGARLSHLGTRTLALPSFDADVVKVLWHVYFPESHTPLQFRGNLQQLSRVQYDPLRRFQMFVESVLDLPEAQAGGKKYKNVLSTRRSVYRREASRQLNDQPVLGSFPLVGTQYRFRRILLGQRHPELSVVYASGAMVSASRWLAMLLWLGVVSFALLSPRRWLSGLLLLATGAALLWWGHHVRHTHRQLVVASNLALMGAIGWRCRGWLRDLGRLLWRAPWTLLERLGLRHLGYGLLAYGMLAAINHYPRFSTLVSLLALSAVWWRVRRYTAPTEAPDAAPQPHGEVSHG